MKQNNALVIPTLEIKAIIGLGNPGPAYSKTRHNIGFEIVNALANQYYGSWESKKGMVTCSIFIHDKKILLIKPTSFMNNSGQVMPALAKQGIKQDNILVIHDELELAFGVSKLKFGGSAKGHNGLKSIIAHGGSDFLRLRFGIARPINREEVPNYVLAKFHEPQDLMDESIDQAISIAIDYLAE